MTRKRAWLTAPSMGTLTIIMRCIIYSYSSYFCRLISTQSKGAEMIEYPYMGTDRRTKARLYKPLDDIEYSPSVLAFRHDYAATLSSSVNMKAPVEFVVGNKIEKGRLAHLPLKGVDLYFFENCLSPARGNTTSLVVFHNPASNEHLVLSGSPQRMDAVFAFRFHKNQEPIKSARDLMIPWFSALGEITAQLSDKGKMHRSAYAKDRVLHFSKQMAVPTVAQSIQLVSGIINPALHVHRNQFQADHVAIRPIVQFNIPLLMQKLCDKR